MTYYFAKTLVGSFDEVVARTREALARQGFGVLTEIDVAATLRAKIGAEIAPYLILGACNPSLAYEALQLEDKVGTMLPCNVVVRDAGDGRTEVAAIDPVASMSAIPNPMLKKQAAIVADKLAAVVADI
ncbi:DUF302 domain-containing protein [Phenylobacterium sp.]|uniref:DUF302 domain-containing protein n=1 Tax=Phenylobacterium sp. TaxID=1871053 RepID=UPI002730FE4B|nr:DUF302 domain-containing protein [Phenylobacterium sp.]MDP1601519.1 DUF302 domain-containing protein [Phenylobacterium sp.]MDP3592932.1 DUF302 domain-containing protein [Phenylobacterium sp.]